MHKDDSFGTVHSNGERTQAGSPLPKGLVKCGGCPPWSTLQQSESMG